MNIYDDDQAGEATGPVLMHVRPPNLTAKALATLMGLPIHKQGDELIGYKYPRAKAGTVRIPYYQAARHALLASLSQGGSLAPVEDALRKLEHQEARESGLVTPSAWAMAKIANNRRALTALADGGFLCSRTGVARGTSCRVTISGVALRSTPHLVCLSRGRLIRVLVDFSATPMDKETARRTLELSHWIEQKSGDGSVKMGQYEYWRVATGESLKFSRRRSTSISTAIKALPLISTVWRELPAPEVYKAGTWEVA